MSEDWEKHDWGLTQLIGGDVTPAPTKSPVVSLTRDRWFCHYLPVTAENEEKLSWYADGETYAEALHGDLDQASEEICLTGLHFTGHFQLVRREGTKPTNPHADTSLQSVLARKSKEGVSIHLLVNQFWPAEGDAVRNHEMARRDLDRYEWKISHPVAGVVIAEGGLARYLKHTLEFFDYLRTHGDPSRIHAYTDIHQGYVMHSNHQKTIVIDKKVAYLGGIDLTDIDGDRWDTNSHVVKDDRRSFDKPERNWHDVHMRIEKSGEAASAVDYVYANFMARYDHGVLYSPRRRSDVQSDGGFAVDTPAATDHEPLGRPGSSARDYVPPEAWVYPHERFAAPLVEPVVQIVRSMPVGKDDTYRDRQRPRWNRSDTPRFERSARDAYLIGIRAARRFIYLENQWIADEAIWNELLVKAREKADDPHFRIVIVIPKKFLVAAGAGRNQDMDLDPHVRAVDRALAAIPGRFGVFSVLASAAHQDPARTHAAVPECVWDYTYVHSKVMIVDDQWALCGSANAGGISLTGLMFANEPDTELSAIVVDERETGSKVAALREMLWAEHLQVKSSDVQDYEKAADLFHDQALSHTYDKTDAKRVHYNLLYFPYSKKANRSVVPNGRNRRAWRHLKWETLAQQLEQRKKDPTSIHSTWFDLSGPLTVVHMLARTDANRYGRLVTDLYELGRSDECKIDEADEDLREADIAAKHPILEIDWMVASSMVDSTNVLLDFQGKATETIAIKTTSDDMIRWMTHMIPCRGGVEHLSCKLWGETKAARRANKRLQAAKHGDVFVAMLVATDLLVGEKEAERKADENGRPANRPTIDRGDPRYWYSRLAPDEVPFCRIERDRTYPLYPGHLTGYDIEHVLPSKTTVELLEPFEVTASGSGAQSVRMKIWVWGARASLEVPTHVFEKAVYGFFVGYRTESAKSEATSDHSLRTDTQTLQRGGQREYLHEDIDRTAVEVQCQRGSITVELARRVWSTWEVVDRRRLGSGSTLKASIKEASRVADQDARVTIQAHEDASYRLTMVSED